jgi:hypothetical protein
MSTRRTYRLLAQTWAACKDLDTATELIAEYANKIPSLASWHGRYYLHDDVEPFIAHALYLAAFTYEPGPGTFYSWWQHKIRGQVSQLRRKVERQRRGLRTPGRRRPGTAENKPGPPIRITSLTPSDIDTRLYYTDEHLLITSGIS